MLSLSGASLGAGFGVFTLGLLVPWSNAIVIFMKVECEIEVSQEQVIFRELRLD